MYDHCSWLLDRGSLEPISRGVAWPVFCRLRRLSREPWRLVNSELSIVNNAEKGMGNDGYVCLKISQNIEPQHQDLIFLKTSMIRIAAILWCPAAGFGWWIHSWIEEHTHHWIRDGTTLSQRIRNAFVPFSLPNLLVASHIFTACQKRWCLLICLEIFGS